MDAKRTILSLTTHERVFLAALQAQQKLNSLGDALHWMIRSVARTGQSTKRPREATEQRLQDENAILREMLHTLQNQAYGEITVQPAELREQCREVPYVQPSQREAQLAASHSHIEHARYLSTQQREILTTARVLVAEAREAKATAREVIREWKAYRQERKTHQARVWPEPE